MSTRLSGTYVVLHQPKEPRVGLLVMVVSVLAVAAIMFWLRSGRGGGPPVVPISAIFENASGLTAGDPVLTAGVRVGRVTEVRLEDVGRVRVFLEIHETVRPYSDATVQIRPLNFIGDVYVAYRPGGVGEPLEAGAELVGVPATEGPFHAREFLGDMQSVMQQGVLARQEIRAEIQATMRALDDALTAVQSLETDAAVAAAREGMEAARRAASRLDTTLAHLHEASALGDVRQSAQTFRDELTRSQAVLDRLLARMDSGAGTVPRLAGDTALQHEVQAVRMSLRRLLRF